MAENLKIFFTVTNDLNYDQRMNRVCSAISEMGFRCTLVGRKLPDSADCKEKIFEQKRFSCFFHQGKAFYIEYNFRLLWFLLFNRFDIVYSVDCDTALPGFIVSRLKGKKWIFDAHELFTEVPEVIQRKGVQKVWAVVQKLAFRYADLRITVGNQLALWFQEKYGREVLTIKNAPAVQQDWPYEPDTDRFILYQGALNEGRGLENLIVAMQQIPCKLKIAGEGDISDKLRSMTSELNLEDKITFLGKILPGDLPRLTARAYIGFNVSENKGLSYYYSLNNKFFDYVHAGLPSLINPFPEYMNLNRIFEVGLITGQNSQEITKNAILLLENEELHRKLSENCLKAREIWNWENEKVLLQQKLEHLIHEE